MMAAIGTPGRAVVEEGVALQFVPRDRLSGESKLAEGEFLAKQPIVIGQVGVVAADVVDGARDDLGVVVRQPPRSVDRDKSG